MYCLLMQGFMVDHGRWNREKSCSEGMVKCQNLNENVHRHDVSLIFIKQFSHFTGSRIGD